MRDIISANASLNNMYKNMAMKEFAKEVLLEENYMKFMKSYKFTFWFQLIGVLAGFIVPSVMLLIFSTDIIYCVFGAVIGIIWACIWLPISLLMPQTRIYRRFAKWFRKSHATIDELDVIFYS